MAPKGVFLPLLVGLGLRIFSSAFKQVQYSDRSHDGPSGSETLSSTGQRREKTEDSISGRVQEGTED